MTEALDILPDHTAIVDAISKELHTWDLQIPQAICNSRPVSVIHGSGAPIQDTKALSSIQPDWRSSPSQNVIRCPLPTRYRVALCDECNRGKSNRDSTKF